MKILSTLGSGPYGYPVTAHPISLAPATEFGRSKLGLDESTGKQLERGSHGVAKDESSVSSAGFIAPEARVIILSLPSVDRLREEIATARRRADIAIRPRLAGNPPVDTATHPRGRIETWNGSGSRPRWATRRR